MFRRRFLAVGVLAALMVTGFLLLGATVLGFGLGRWSAASWYGTAAPEAPRGFVHPGGHVFGPLLCGVGLLFKVGLFLLLLILFGKLIHLFAWKMAAVDHVPVKGGGPRDKRGAGHWHWCHGPFPHGPMRAHWFPWCAERPADEEGEEDESDEDTVHAKVHG